MLARGVNHKWDACPNKGSTQAPVHPHIKYQSNVRESHEHDETSMTEIPVCPRERVSSYKTLFRLVPCYKRDWATCCTISTTCYLLLFAHYVSPRYTITCYRYFQCLYLLPCWNPFIRAFCSSLGLTLLLIVRTTIDPLYLWVIMGVHPTCLLMKTKGILRKPVIGIYKPSSIMKDSH